MSQPTPINRYPTDRAAFPEIERDINTATVAVFCGLLTVATLIGGPLLLIANGWL